MKVVILAGGLGTRLSEETAKKPKPMVEIGNMPILWHIMKIYSYYGIDEFIICCGYKSHIIKEFFSNYQKKDTDSKVEIEDELVHITFSNKKSWKICLVDTGLKTMTGGRLKRVKKYIGNDKEFCFTYGDGLSNINISSSIEFHKAHKKIATIAAVHPPGRFGALEIKSNGFVESFKEKPEGDDSWINGGFFVLSKSVFNYIEGDNTFWEREPLENLAKENQLVAYKHSDFWQPMDTLREKNILEKMWASNPIWKKW